MIGKWRISFGWEHAGLITIWSDSPDMWDTSWSFHFIPSHTHWVWGFEKDWYDGPLLSWGLGPLFLINRHL
jgi:hypothetical protein